MNSRDARPSISAERRTANAVLILEDDDSRIDCFAQALPSIAAELFVVTWNDAHAMIREVDQYLHEARIISLDHDLYPPGGQSHDPGDGLDVAKHLASLVPCCPVIIHSSNADRAHMMQGEFELGGWSCRRVLPFGSDWIEKNWCWVVREMLDL